MLFVSISCGARYSSPNHFPLRIPLPSGVTFLRVRTKHSGAGWDPELGASRLYPESVTRIEFWTARRAFSTIAFSTMQTPGPRRHRPGGLATPTARCRTARPRLDPARVRVPPGLCPGRDGGAMSVVPQPAPAFAHPPAPVERGTGARVDGELKVSGQVLYSDDLAIEGLLHVAVLRSPHAHARLRSVDTSAARRLPGVRAVLTGADVATLRFGRAVYDVPILAVDKVRFVGEMVAAVAADDRDTAEEAVNLIEVEYEPLPAVFDPVEALRPDAPAV